MNNLIHSFPLVHPTGMHLIEIHSRVRRSSYEHLVLETTLDLMQRGFITTVNHEPDHFLIGLRHQTGRPIAYIVFEPKPLQELAHVILGGTVEEYRCSGLYSCLFKELAEFLGSHSAQEGRWHEKLAGIKKITGCYHVDNDSARIMNEKLGRRPMRVTTEYDL